MYKTISLYIILIFITFNTSAQQVNKLEDVELTIHELFEELFISNGTKFTQADHLKLALANEISEEFKKILIKKESFKYPFDSLKRIGIRTSKDKKIRIYTWSIKLKNGDHLYYGFIQKKERKRIKVFQLIDDSDNIKEDIAYLPLDHKHWYGVNYYQIIDFKYRGKKMYALLGMRNNGYISKIKLIDILSFSGKHAKFGKSVFKFDRKDDPKREKRRIQRIMMEYNHKMAMTLTYDPNFKMIIFDHLAPENSKLKDIRRFYGPDGSYDAFYFDTFKWKYIPDHWTTNQRNSRQEMLKDKMENKKIYENRSKN